MVGAKTHSEHQKAFHSFTLMGLSHRTVLALDSSPSNACGETVLAEDGRSELRIRICRIPNGTPRASTLEPDRRLGEVARDSALDGA